MTITAPAPTAVDPAAPALRRMIETGRELLPRLLPEGSCTVIGTEYGTEDPRIEIQGPAIITIGSDGIARSLRLIGRLQYIRRADRFEWLVLHPTKNDETHFPSSEMLPEGLAWIEALDALADALGTRPDLAAHLSATKPRSGKDAAANKARLLERYLDPSAHMLAKGYAELGIGPKSLPFDADQLEEQTRTLIDVIDLWTAALDEPS